MEALPSQSLLPCSFRSPSCLNNEQPKNGIVAENKQNRLRPLTVKNVPRRLFLQLMGFKFNSLLFLLQPVSAAPLPEMKEPEVIRTLKLPSGVRIQEIIEGEGPKAREGNTVEINYVCRRSNGYFVHSTVDQFSGESSPVILLLDENQIIRGLKEVLIGMRVGGKRRALIPPSVGYVNENLKPIPEAFGPRRSLLSHANEPLIFEVQLLKLL
ncbi:Peptidyl-prolyl cis-trans isomerase FKBP16-1 [Morus notabilis]|uniref:peptidylprolyl isomerase n=1 Tax=Morus notabilis TaxID=981085 RepID=W9RM54_9ROSA|nr:peptidyl-prolyl cis-trans isomerase FKBP16-1, chloroplastic isoform X2 [Morus notabilis]EXB97664.1 Peptidyl-prolyl cis-trans isomerase FKBP16-1 [Morus notabilis]